MKPALYIISFLLLVVFILSCESKGNNNTLSINTSSKKIVPKDSAHHNTYSWLASYTIEEMLVNRIEVPEGFERTTLSKGSFGDWLLHLPLKPGHPEVKLYNGNLKYNQSAQFAVLNIDPGKEDLQQCADAVMRLKSEYHFSKKENDQIHFKFTSGDNAAFTKWAQGYRPVVKNNKVSWTKSSRPDNSYKSFRSYLRQVFMYAGTSSLSKEMTSISLESLQPGDVFIHGGFPGHAAIIVDMAINKSSGEKIFMIAQSYMPAQDIHVLKNPGLNDTPWYSMNFKGSLETPEWTFERTEVKRFK
jgi:hypothetical protein